MGRGESQGGLVGNLIGMLNNIFNTGGQEVYEGGLSFDQILQQIILNDPNHYGPPPAAKSAIENLPKGLYSKFFPKDEEAKEDDKKEENLSCNVCYDEYNYEDTQE
jgi:hypothetical protein